MSMERRDESIKLLDPIVPFENYIEHLITLLRYLRIWRQGNTFSMSKLFVLTIIVAISLFANFLLVLCELLMVSGTTDIERLSNTINPVGLHMTGFVKWIYCISKSKEISRLVADLNQCYLLSKRIDISKRGKIKKKKKNTKQNNNYIENKRLNKLWKNFFRMRFFQNGNGNCIQKFKDMAIFVDNVLRLWDTSLVFQCTYSKMLRSSENIEYK